MLYTLEVLKVALPLSWLVVAFDNFTVALLQPCFRNLKGLNLQVMKSVHCVNQLGFFDKRVGIFQWRLGELGMNPNIKFTMKLVPDCSMSNIMC